MSALCTVSSENVTSTIASAPKSSASRTSARNAISRSFSPTRASAERQPDIALIRPREI